MALAPGFEGDNGSDFVPMDEHPLRTMTQSLLAEGAASESEGFDDEDEDDDLDADLLDDEDDLDDEDFDDDDLSDDFSDEDIEDEDLDDEDLDDDDIEDVLLLTDRKCLRCGCTDADCRLCIERTGLPCHWVAPNLCSACGEPDDVLSVLF